MIATSSKISQFAIINYLFMKTLCQLPCFFSSPPQDFANFVYSTFNRNAVVTSSHSHCKRATLGPLSLQKSCDMKTCDVSHCVSSLLRKLVMLAPTKKNHEVSGRTAHAQFTRSTIPSMHAIRFARKEIRGMYKINNERWLVLGIKQYRYTV